jgi:hypothetical protein
MTLEKTARVSRFRDDFLAVVGLLLLIALRFSFTLAKHRLYGPFQDNVSMLGPMFAETARLALHGTFPYYLPSFGTGFPLFESPHYSVCYPFYFFGLLDYGGPLQSLYTLTGVTIFHRFLFGLNLYAMLRCARVSPWAGFAAASIGMFARNTELYSSWVTMTASYTWMPLVFGGAILLFRFPGNFWAILLLGISAGLLTLATAAQPVSHAMFFCVVFFMAVLLRLILRRDIEGAVRLSLSLLAAGTIAFALAAVTAVPVLLGIERMIRHIGGGFVLGHEAIPWEKFSRTDLQLNATQLLGILVHPKWLSVVGSPYVGPLGVAGVILALLFYRRLDSMQRFLLATIGGLGLYGLLSGCGSNLGLAYINYYLPLINKSREPVRHLMFFLFAVILLTGFGLDQLGRVITEREARSRPGRAVWICLLTIGSISFAVLIWEFWIDLPVHEGRWIVLLLAPLLLLIALLLRIRLSPAIAIAALVSSTASAVSPPRTFDLWSSTYVEPANLRTLEILTAIRDKVGSGDFRIDFIDKQSNPIIFGMYSSFFGFNTFYNQITPQPYDQFRFSRQHDIPNVRAMMGARYVLCNEQAKPPDPAKAVWETQGYTLYENQKFMGRMVLVHSLAGTIKTDDQFTKEITRGFDFLESAYVQQSDATRVESVLSSAKAEIASSNDQIHWIDDTANHIAVTLESARSGLLVLNEWFNPAWHASVNGDPKEILRVNRWQIGVPLGAGKNVVEFTYRPMVFWRLLILNRVAWLLLAALIVARSVPLALNAWSGQGISKSEHLR